MFNLFYKTILVSVVSLMLSFGELIAFADSKGTLIKNKDGTVEKTNTYNFKGGSASDDSAMQILTMLAVGFVGTKLITYKKWTPDMMVAAGASAVYLGGEVINLMSYKKKVEDVEAKVKFTDGKVDSAQVEYIKQLKKSYEDVKSALETKKKLQSVAFLGYLAAAGVATYQFFTEEGLYANCEMALINSVPTLTSCMAITPPTSENVPCGKCKAGLSTYQGFLTKIKAEKEAPGPSGAKAAGVATSKTSATSALVTGCTGGAIASGVSASIKAACGTYFVEETKNEAVNGLSSLNNFDAGSSVVTQLIKNQNYLYTKEIAPNSIFKNKIKNLVSLLIPTANAGWMSMLGLGGGVAAAFLTAQTSIGLTVDQTIFSPMGRIAVWGGFALLTKLAMSGTESKIKEMEENISKIDKIINEMDKLTAGVKGANANVTKAKINTSGIKAADYALSSTDKTGCATANCKSVSTQIGDAISGISGLPSSFADAAKGVGKVADGVSNTGTISAGTISNASSVGSGANAISKKLKDLQSAVNQKLKEKGKSSVDFDGLGNQAKNSLLKSAENSLKGSGYSAGNLLASLGLSPGNTSGVEEPKDAAKKISDTNSAFPTMPNKKENFDFGDDKKDEAQMAVAPTAADKAQYDMGGTDVSKDQGANIFDIISSRYLKSAFPKLLDEEKKQP